MGKYSIGLDLGINNVGWAIYDYNSSKIIDKGVARYEASDSAADRRINRSSRRLNKRKHQRVERIAILLNSIGFNTKRSYEPELLLKRIDGLDKKITEQELINIIYYFTIHRGYIPYNDEKEEREVYHFKEDEFPCHYLKHFHDQYNKYRGVSDLILLEDNIRELREILNKQKEFYSQLSDENIKKIIDIISSKREFWEGPGAPKENQLSPYGRYKNLNDLYEYKNNNNYHKYLYELLIGKCELTIDENGNMENVAPKYNYYAEEFNFYNDFINMSVILPENVDEQLKHKIDLKTGKFTEETIEEIKNIVLSSKTCSLKKVIKQTLNIELSDIQGYRQKKNGEPDVAFMDFYKKLVKKFKGNNLNPKWLLDEDKSNYNKIIYILTVAPSSVVLNDMIKDRLKDVEISNDEIEILKTIKQKENANLKYHSLSESILKRALYDMKRSGMQYNYIQIMKMQEYEKEMKEYFQNNYSSIEKEPFLIEDKYIDDIIANPQVKKTLRKAIKIINTIIKQQNDYPYVIQIESAKEMNGKNAANQIEKEQRTYEKLNQQAKLLLEENGYTINDKHIDLVICWQETNYKCAYCGKPISIKDIMASDVEHILPKSQTMDGTHENITCSCSNCNKEKGNRTPWEWLTSKNQYDTYKQRVLSEFKITEKKKNNLLFEGSIEKYSIRFINRNLRDVAYGTVALIEELKKYNEYLYNKTGYKINLVSSPGQLTHRLRRYLNINEKDRNFLFHHAVDAMILASIPDTYIGEVLIESQNDSKYWIKNKKDKNEVFDNIKNIKLKNYQQIKEFNTKCESLDDKEKDSLIKRSYEVKRNPIRKFANSNYVKYITKGDHYYKISSIDNIYNLIIRDKSGKPGKDKSLLDKLFDEKNTTVELLCQEKDPKLFNKLKQIYQSYFESENPFISECIYKNGLEQNKKFDYLLYGIRKTENPNSPIVCKLKYMEKVTKPYLKELKQKRKNIYGEFIVTKQKENTKIGLVQLSQTCTSVYYSYTKAKFVFVPLYSICYKNGKIDENNLYYKELYNNYVGDQKVKKLFDLYCGNIIGIYKKDDKYVEGKVSCFHKTNNRIDCSSSGTHGEVYFTTSDQRVIVYTTDILGNRVKKFDTKDLI